MLKKLAYIMAFILLVPSASYAADVEATAEIGKPAPDFTGTDVIKSQPIKLSDYKGKFVVLEWTNNECPFVKKHYETGNMQETQKAAEAKGAQWISIVSSAPGKQGNVTAAEALKIIKDTGASPNAKILDESGTIGHLYGATSTPDMIVIDKSGNVAYMGAIDDQPTPDHESVKGAKNYVLAAIDDLEAGRPVATPQTQSYGCGIKYQN
jgi:peroxiredoxin